MSSPSKGFRLTSGKQQYLANGASREEGVRELSSHFATEYLHLCMYVYNDAANKDRPLAHAHNQATSPNLLCCCCWCRRCAAAAALVDTTQQETPQPSSEKHVFFARTTNKLNTQIIYNIGSMST